MTSTVGRKGSAKEKRLPGGCKFTDDMTEDQKLEHIQERKEYMLSKKTRKQEIAAWGEKALEGMQQFFIDFDLQKAKGGKDFVISTEFKKKLEVPNPNFDDLRRKLKEIVDAQTEADAEILQIRTNIADACEMTVEDIDGELGDKMREQIKKGRPKVKKGPTYVPKHMLAKGWDIRYTTKNDACKEEGKPYYVHIMRQLSQWDPPDRQKDGDPPTPPPTPDPELEELDAGWYVKIRDKDDWEKFTETRYWRKDIQTGVPTRAQRIQMLLDIMRSDEGQKAATSPIYGAKRRYRHANPDAQWDEGGLLIVPEKPKKEEKAAEPEQKDGEGDAEAEGGEGDGEGDGGEGEDEEEDESEEEDEDVALCQKVDDFEGEKFNKVFPADLVQLMPRRLQNKSCKVKFEYPRGCTPPPTPPESDAGDEDGGGDGGGGDAYEDSEGGGFSD